MFPAAGPWAEQDPAGGRADTSSPGAVMLLLTPSAAIFVLFCSQLPRHVHAAVVSGPRHCGRAKVKHLLGIWQRHYDNLCWQRKGCVGRAQNAVCCKRASSGRSYTSSKWYKLKWYKNALLSSEIHRDTSLLARDVWSHTPCWNKYASRTLHCGLEKCCISKAKPTQAQLLAADNSSSSPAPLGADPVENTHPLLSLLPFGCCLCSGGGSSTLGCHTCHPAWCIMARSKAQALSLCPASWGTLGQWSLALVPVTSPLRRLLGWQDAPQRFFLLVRGFWFYLSA